MPYSRSMWTDFLPGFKVNVSANGGVRVRCQTCYIPPRNGRLVHSGAFAPDRAGAEQWAREHQHTSIQSPEDARRLAQVRKEYGSEMDTRPDLYAKGRVVTFD